jgi:hypothetical protein
MKGMIPDIRNSRKSPRTLVPVAPVIQKISMKAPMKISVWMMFINRPTTALRWLLRTSRTVE